VARLLPRFVFVLLGVFMTLVQSPLALLTAAGGLVVHALLAGERGGKTGTARQEKSKKKKKKKAA
jgi:hypothetical protein